ncbi:DUF3048 domain-containing protein [Anoxynatronum sibiricum]|uniref:DUF3048 domain-containing protein n=1 Tax=Anoxynatronum sibiricum TaxID=210623 RepID=A0ABU9VRH6_9CLOT
MKNRIKWLILLLLVVSLWSVACGSSAPQEDPAELEETIVEEIMTEEPEPDPIPEGMAKSPLTGLWIPEEMVKVRPVAMQINNIRVAYPQSGISQADIIYETLAEGNITRLLAVFHVYDAAKIGPIRSARHYYLDMAASHDALYMHYGGSPQAYDYISRMKAPNLDGLPKPDGVLSWRDPERRSIPRMLEHSVYTSHELIEEAWEKAGYRREVADDFESGLLFRSEPKAPLGQRADYVTIPFSNAYISTFDYDPETREYIKYQSGEPHLDELSGEPLRFANLIVQRTNIFVIPGDDAGRREINIVGSGKGHYISEGRTVAIEWSKAAYNQPTRYVEAKTGLPLAMNPGKTYIAIFPERQEITLLKPAETTETP